MKIYSSRSNATRAAKGAADRGDYSLADVTIDPVPGGFVINVASSDGDEADAKQLDQDDAQAANDAAPADAQMDPMALAAAAAGATTPDDADEIEAMQPYVTAAAAEADTSADEAVHAALVADEDAARAEAEPAQPYGPPAPPAAANDDDAEVYGPPAPPVVTTEELLVAARDEAGLRLANEPKLAWLLGEMAVRLEAFLAGGKAPKAAKAPKAPAQPKAPKPPAAPKAPPAARTPAGQTAQVIAMATRPTGALRSELDTLPKNTTGYYNWRGRLRGIAATWGYDLSETAEGEDVRFTMVAQAAPVAQAA